jgi:hypothetical protein
VIGAVALCGSFWSGNVVYSAIIDRNGELECKMNEAHFYQDRTNMYSATNMACLKCVFVLDDGK